MIKTEEYVKPLGLDIIRQNESGIKITLGGMEIPYVENYKVEPLNPIRGNIAELTLKIRVEFPINFHKDRQ